MTLTQTDWTLLVEYLKVKQQKIVTALNSSLQFKLIPHYLNWLINLVTWAKQKNMWLTKTHKFTEHLQTTVEIMLKSIAMVSKSKVWYSDNTNDCEGL